MTTDGSCRPGCGMLRFVRMLLASCAMLIAGLLAGAPSNSQTIEWRRLPLLPDVDGFAYPFAGVDGGALIVAGGANFPDLMPWEGGTKVWYDSAFVLERGATSWKTGLKLPRPLAYGVSIATNRGIACLGGSDSQRHYRDAFLMRYADERLEFAALPDLPRPCANFCGARCGNVLYVAGGIDRPDATDALQTFWSLDLSAQEPVWRELVPWPGPGRMLATAGALGNTFYLFGGTALSQGVGGAAIRSQLRDGYRYRPDEGWQKIADLPRPAVAAPSPAPGLGPSHLVLLGGDDGSQTNTPPDEHRGFSRSALVYHRITDSWVELEQLSFALVTTPTAEWNGEIIVPGGERQPGVRSNQVWAGKPRPRKTTFGWLNYSALFAYLLGMVAIGWYCAARNRNTDDYFKAGGRIPWWAAGISIYATTLSSLTFMAIPAKAYAADWTFVWANVPILLLAPLVIRYYLPFFRQLNLTSAYEYLEQRFNLAARLYASAAFILFQIGRQSIVLLLPSLALATVSDLDVPTCVLLMGVLCVAYTVMGGMEAVVWTDVAQSIVLVGGAFLSLVMILCNTDGGLAGAWSTAIAHGKLNSINWTFDPTTTANAIWVIVVGNLFINLVPYTSDQAVVQRYMTTQDEKQAARAIWTNALLSIPSTVLFFAIGTALFVYYRQHPIRLDPLQTTDAIFPSFIVANLPVGVAGLVIAGIFAAAQSTVSGSLNSVVTAIMTDFYRRFGGTADDRSSLRLARWLTAIIGAFTTVVALVLAESKLVSLWDAYFNLVGLAGSGLAGLFALGIFTRRAHGLGAMIGAVVSAGVLYWVQQNTHLHFFLYAAIGVVTCFIVGWLTSAVLPGQDKPIAGLTIHDKLPASESP